MSTLYIRYPANFGVTSINTLTGPITLAAGTGITITPAGNTLTIASTSGGDVTLTAFGSTPNANGASLSGQALTLQPADATRPGGNSIVAQSFGGLKTFTNGVQLATTGGTPATLNAYEEGSFTANFNQNAGAGGTNTSYTVNFVQIGKTVTLLFPNMLITAGATVNRFATAAATLPTRIRPVTANVNGFLYGNVNGVDSATPLQYTVGTGGAITIYRDGAEVTTFTSAAVSGPYACAVTYTIQ